MFASSRKQRDLPFSPSLCCFSLLEKSALLFLPFYLFVFPRLYIFVSLRLQLRTAKKHGLVEKKILKTFTNFGITLKIERIMQMLKFATYF